MDCGIISHFCFFYICGQDLYFSICGYPFTIHRHISHAFSLALIFQLESNVCTHHIINALSIRKRGCSNAGNGKILALLCLYCGRIEIYYIIFQISIIYHCCFNSKIRIEIKADSCLYNDQPFFRSIFSYCLVTFNSKISYRILIHGILSCQKILASFFRCDFHHHLDTVLITKGFLHSVSENGITFLLLHRIFFNHPLGFFRHLVSSFLEKTRNAYILLCCKNSGTKCHHCRKCQDQTALPVFPCTNFSHSVSAIYYSSRFFFFPIPSIGLCRILYHFQGLIYTPAHTFRHICFF